MSTALIDYCKSEIEALKEARTFKKERVLEGPTGARVRVDGREVLMLTSNNYLGFANHPRMVDANYERYLENRLREAFDFTGTPIRLKFRQKG